MLNPELAQEQLAAIRDPKWRAKCCQKIAKLPDPLKAIGYAFFDRNAAGKIFASNPAATEQKSQLLASFDDLPTSDRLTIFQTFFPKIATTVEAAWQLWPTLTYQSGYYRRSFRLPQHPELTANNRLEWLQNLVSTVEGYDQELLWLVDWAAHLGWQADCHLPVLFAAAIDQNDQLGQDVLTALIGGATGEREMGSMGRYMIRALLLAHNPEGWAFIEKTLLVAQRQEGLRQVILEAIDEAHPQAFQRFLGLILDENLLRFSATARAVTVWFGFDTTELTEKMVRPMLLQVQEFLANAAARSAALGSDDAATVYFALWCEGFTDGMAALELAQQLLSYPQPSHRYVAVKLLRQLDIHPASLALLPALGDEDLRVAMAAFNALSRPTPELLAAALDTFTQLEQLLARLPAKAQTLQSPVWAWENLAADQSLVANGLLSWVEQVTTQRLMPYLNLLSPYDRLSVANLLATGDRYATVADLAQRAKSWDEATRMVLLDFLGDSSSVVREGVLEMLKHCSITAADSPKIEQLLTRKASGLRRGAIGLLLGQEDGRVIAAAQRLLASRKDLQRQAGLELLKEMVEKARQVDDCRTLATTYRSAHAQLTATESQLLMAIESKEQSTPTLHDALGLLNRTELSPAVRVSPQAAVTLQTPARLNCLLALDELVHKHRQTPVQIIDDQGGQEEELLGNLTWRFPRINAAHSPAENLARLPLADVWENWWQNRPESLRDADGWELLRTTCPAFGALLDTEDEEEDEDEKDEEMASVVQDPVWLEVHRQLLTLTGTKPSLRYPYEVEMIINWLLYLHPPQSDVSAFTLDSIATVLQVIPSCTAQNHLQYDELRSVVFDFVDAWVEFGRRLLVRGNSGELAPQTLRWWQLLHWIDRSYLYSWRWLTSIEDIYLAYELGGATEADLLYYLMGTEMPRGNDVSGLDSMVIMDARTNFTDLGELTRRHLDRSYSQYPALVAIADRCRQRIIEVEVQRGELPTAASRAAGSLRSIEGIPVVMQLLQALDQGNFKRGSNWSDFSKPAIISHLMRISFPAAADTPVIFAAQVAALQIPAERLIQLAFYAPQWAQYIEHTLGWPSFANGVWWIHAHTKDSQWSVEQDVRDTWIAQIAERTPLSAQDLLEGAVDVAWFQQVYQALGADRWLLLDEAAKYAANGAGHQRAKLFANAMLGEVVAQDLLERISSKRNQDAIRALGLLPLAKGAKGQGEILQRYQVLQEFLRTSKKFGSQRQASEKLATAIGMDNLARTAGYSDPQRLQWAMEAQAVADLVDRPQTVTAGEVTVSLQIDAMGSPIITITKAGKALKAIPANLKKQPEIQAMSSRKQDIAKQASRMRLSLEQSMVRGDSFTREELEQLATHPVLWPMLKDLVLMGDRAGEQGKQTDQPAMGYLQADGKSWAALDGQVTAIKGDRLRLAHPYDLLQTRAWGSWQQDCFDRARSQVFKQLFRELYVPTAAELKEKISKRYEGHQVNPRQAMALLGQRGWVTLPDGEARRTFHGEGLVVSLELIRGYGTPLEMEGLTLRGVRFYARDSWEPLVIKEVPPRLFSEVMRDLDLVVSVAHVGGFDPEASASTVEMRSTIVRETLRLLRLSNVQIQSAHCLITGDLGTYSVHLGSGVVHRQPGGSLCILPVSAQQRGRLFLPFVDDDPKTAEIVAKILLLAKDRDIKDPTILEQILQ
jgi:hypothetical protein